MTRPSHKQKCDLEVNIEGRFQCRYSLAKNTTVAELLQKISSDYDIDTRRLTLTIMPQGTKMDNDQQTLASYGIAPGETTTKLHVGVAPIKVAALFSDYPGEHCFTECHDLEPVAYLRARIAASLQLVGPVDLTLTFNRVKLADLEAPLWRYGVKDMSFVEVKVAAKVMAYLRRRKLAAMVIADIQRHPTSALKWVLPF